MGDNGERNNGVFVSDGHMNFRDRLDRYIVDDARRTRSGVKVGLETHNGLNMAKNWARCKKKMNQVDPGKF